jgi:hypothetical protein
MLVALYEALLETNESTAETSYHLTGSIDPGRIPALAARRVGASAAIQRPAP